jgi:hypothetical protein
MGGSSPGPVVVFAAERVVRVDRVGNADLTLAQSRPGQDLSS